MSEKPIIMTAHSVRAILAGRKTQTRRVLKPQPAYGKFDDFYTMPDGLLQMRFVESRKTGDYFWTNKAPHAVDDHLWVKEAFATDGPIVRYAATDDIHDLREKKSPLFMPRWASRITLQVTGVKVERLQDISEADAQAEGVEPVGVPTGRIDGHGENIEQGSYRAAYSEIWNSIHGPGAWDANVWVVAITFRRVTP